MAAYFCSLISLSIYASNILSGIILNIVNQQRGLIGSVPWTDPVVLRMGALVAWLIFVAATSRTMRQQAVGRRITAVL